MSTDKSRFKDILLWTIYEQGYTVSSTKELYKWCVQNTGLKASFKSLITLSKKLYGTPLKK